MDAELKALLTKLCDRLDGVESRLREVEATSHKQITLEDYFHKYKQTLQPTVFSPGVGAPWPNQFVTIC